MNDQKPPVAAIWDEAEKGKSEKALIPDAWANQKGGVRIGKPGDVKIPDVAPKDGVSPGAPASPLSKVAAILCFLCLLLFNSARATTFTFTVTNDTAYTTAVGTYVSNSVGNFTFNYTTNVPPGISNVVSYTNASGVYTTTTNQNSWLAGIAYLTPFWNLSNTNGAYLSRVNSNYISQAGIVGAGTGGSAGSPTAGATGVSTAAFNISGNAATASLASNLVGVAIGNGAGLTNVPNWFQGSGYVQVDPRGSDTLGQRNGYPFLSITDAVTHMQNYDTLYLPAGTNNYYAQGNISLPIGGSMVGRGQAMTFVTLSQVTALGTNYISNLSMSGVFVGTSSYSNITWMSVTIDNYHTNAPWVNLSTDCIYEGLYYFALVQNCNFYSVGDDAYNFYYSTFDHDIMFASSSHSTDGCIAGDDDLVINCNLSITNATQLDTSCINTDDSYDNKDSVYGTECFHDGNSKAVGLENNSSGTPTFIGEWFDNGTNVIGQGPLLIIGPAMASVYESTNGGEAAFMGAISNSTASQQVYFHITNGVPTATTAH